MQRDLVLRAQAGDHEAFSALAAAAISRLHRTARLILRDEDAANDAVQDALTTAWLKIRSVRDPERFDAWLNRLVVRSCFNISARGRRRSLVELRGDQVERSWSGSPEHELAIRDQIDRAFRRLTAEQRAVLVVRYYLDLSDAEGAGVLGIPLGTFKSRLNRATSALRAAMEADERVAPRPGEAIA